VGTIAETAAVVTPAYEFLARTGLEMDYVLDSQLWGRNKDRS
jgi:hypothetical protein